MTVNVQVSVQGKANLRVVGVMIMCESRTIAALDIEITNKSVLDIVKSFTKG
jgi:hypothetical protein